MDNSVLKLHPESYKEVDGRLIFYFDSNVFSEEEFEKVWPALTSARTLVLTSYISRVEDRRYLVYVDKFVIGFSMSAHNDLHCNYIVSGKRAIEQKEKLYRTKIFTIIPTGGVYAKHNGVTAPEYNLDSRWMTDFEYQDLFNRMEYYFENDDLNNYSSNYIRIPDGFRRKIIKPFRDYNDIEIHVEQLMQYRGEGILYSKREFVQKNDKGSTYNFYSNDKNANPENEFLKIGDRVAIVKTDSPDHSICTGLVQDIDDESDESVIFSIALYQQTDDTEIPAKGKLIMAVNDTQTRIRNKVIDNMEMGQIDSKYMYKVFDEFTPEGYEEIPDDLKDFLAEKMAGEFPPNQMQLEAIIKGILTEDLLLVLGPPGTGKTTVISYWIEYFLKQGKRILISSMNNAAVDNVLARFGKMAETVRLGNELKVQSDCQSYLPQNKIEAMQNHYNSNHKRVVKEIDKNQKEISNYKEKLQKYKELYDQYKQQKDGLKEFYSVNKESFLKIKEIHNNIVKIEEKIDGVLEERAHKVIFLQVYEKKNFIVKLFRKKYAQRVREELAASDGILEDYRSQYSKLATGYNSIVKILKEKNESFRAKNLLDSYYEALDRITEYNSLVKAADFIPEIAGELAELYEKPEFKDSINTNYKIVVKQLKEIEKIEKGFKDMTFALDEWNSIVNNDRNDIMQNALLESCQIVGATCIGINSNRDFAKVQFDVVIVDEAGQIQVHNALVPMTRARKNLLLGDYKQIPPNANEEVIKECKMNEIDTKLYCMSFFEYIFETMRKKTIKEMEAAGKDRSEILKPLLPDYVPEPYKKFEPETVQNMIESTIADKKKLVNLNSQFRMPGEISDIISEWFYEGNYYSSYNMEGYKTILPNTEKPLVVIDTSEEFNRVERRPANGMGYENEYEAIIVVKTITRVIEGIPYDERHKFINEIATKIGVITPYGAQARLIRDMLKQSNLGIKNSDINEMVSSLDSFQGQERPLIIYSFTRSTRSDKLEKDRIGFMKELRRTNVALTRSQKQLVVVGDMSSLSHCMKILTNEDSEGRVWPCVNEEERDYVDQEMINQCANCVAVCERKYARFIRLFMQHVKDGAGDLFKAEEYLKRKA